MKPNQTLSSEGYQVCLFPLETLNITQWSSPDSYSHCCGHPFDNAISGQTRVPVYAPFDCYLVYSDNVGNTRAYCSNDKVWTPQGLSYVTVSFTHDPNPPTATRYKQGELIYHTGTAGYATGDHVHIDQTFTRNAGLVNYGYRCRYGNVCYALSGSTLPTNVFYLNDTNIVNGYGQDWKIFQGGEQPPEPEPEPTYKYINHYVMLDGLGIDFGFYKTREEIKPEPEPGPEPGQYNWIIPGDINSTRPLTEEESKNNWLAFWSFFKAKGWTANAVAGILGNSFYESTVNPNRWQGDIPFAQPVASQGYGLVQWTPWTKIIDWLKEKGYYPDVSKFGQGECERIQWEMENNQQWIATSAYPESFASFSKSTADPYTLAIEFLANYERPLDPNQPQRGTKAREIYEYIKSK